MYSTDKSNESSCFEIPVDPSSATIVLCMLKHFFAGGVVGSLASLITLNAVPVTFGVGYLMFLYGNVPFPRAMAYTEIIAAGLGFIVGGCMFLSAALKNGGALIRGSEKSALIPPNSKPGPDFSSPSLG